MRAGRHDEIAWLALQERYSVASHSRFVLPKSSTIRGNFKGERKQNDKRDPKADLWTSKTRIRTVSVSYSGLTSCPTDTQKGSYTAASQQGQQYNPQQIIVTPTGLVLHPCQRLDLTPLGTFRTTSPQSFITQASLIQSVRQLR